MAPQPAPMPTLPLPSGYIVTFDAIDPDTGADVSGVTVALATLYTLDDQSEVTDRVIVGPFMLVPGPNAVGS